MMLTWITVSFSLFFVAVTGWTITTYFVKENSQILIKAELKNLFDISKMLFVSLKNLIKILAKNSLSLESSNTTSPVESNELNEQPLTLVKPVKEIESTSLKLDLEDNDTALSSFSPEVVEVITEEEEKVA